MRRILAGVVLSVMLTGGAAALDPDTTTLDCVFEHQNTIDITDGKLSRDDAPLFAWRSSLARVIAGTLSPRHCYDGRRTKRSRVARTDSVYSAALTGANCCLMKSPTTPWTATATV